MMRSMSRPTLDQPVTLSIGTMSRPHLLEALRNRGVGLNESATTLLGDSIFDRAEPQSVTFVDRSVSELGLIHGAVLSQIFEAARESGLRLCPPTTGPYLRLALQSQTTAPDTVLSNGQAPSGSLTVASFPLRPDPDYPRGFYLRVIGGQPWLRGYRCSDDHVWNLGDRFVFEASRSTAVLQST